MARIDWKLSKMIWNLSDSRSLGPSKTSTLLRVTECLTFNSWHSLPNRDLYLVRSNIKSQEKKPRFPKILRLRPGKLICAHAFHVAFRYFLYHVLYMVSRENWTRECTVCFGQKASILNKKHAYKREVQVKWNVRVCKKNGTLNSKIGTVQYKIE